MSNKVNEDNDWKTKLIHKRLGRDSNFVHVPSDADSHYTWKFFVNFPDKLYKDIARTKTDEEIAELTLSDKLNYMDLYLPRDRFLHISEHVEADQRYPNIEYMLINPKVGPVYHGDYVDR